MTLPHHPLLRFTIYAVTGLCVAIMLASATGLYDLLPTAAAILIGSAALLARIRTWTGALSALTIAVAVYMAIFILPHFVLLDGSFYPTANRNPAEHAMVVTGMFALPVLAGALLSGHLPRLGKFR